MVPIKLEDKFSPMEVKETLLEKIKRKILGSWLTCNDFLIYKLEKFN